MIHSFSVYDYESKKLKQRCKPNTFTRFIMYAAKEPEEARLMGLWSRTKYQNDKYRNRRYGNLKMKKEYCVLRRYTQYYSLLWLSSGCIINSVGSYGCINKILPSRLVAYTPYSTVWLPEGCNTIHACHMDVSSSTQDFKSYVSNPVRIVYHCISRAHVSSFSDICVWFDCRFSKATTVISIPNVFYTARQRSGSPWQFRWGQYWVALRLGWSCNSLFYIILI